MCSVDTFLSTDAFYLNFLHILTAIEIPVHLFGAYIILFKTPKKMANVKTSMLTLHGLGALCDVYLSFIASPVVIIPELAGYPLEVSLWLGIPTSVQVYIGFCSGFVVCASVLIFFEDRLFVLKNGPVHQKSVQRTIYQVFIYLLSVTYILPAFFAIPNFEDAKLAVMEKIPCFSVDRFYRSGFFLLTIDSTLCVSCFTSLLIFFLGQLFYFGISIGYELFKINAKSKCVARAQKQFMIALGVQVAVPVVIFAVPVIVIIFFVTSEYYNQGLTNMGMAVMASHGIASTITMLIVHTPYREATLEMCRLRRSKSNATVQSSKIWILN